MFYGTSGCRINYCILDLHCSAKLLMLMGQEYMQGKRCHQRVYLYSRFHSCTACSRCKHNCTIHNSGTLTSVPTESLSEVHTSLPSWVLFSSATLPAREIAATRRGWVMATMPCLPMPASYRYWGIWVVFPEPVSPGEWVKSGHSLQCVFTGNGPYAQLDGIQPTDFDAKINISELLWQLMSHRKQQGFLKIEQSWQFYRMFPFPESNTSG